MRIEMTYLHFPPLRRVWESGARKARTASRLGAVLLAILAMAAPVFCASEETERLTARMNDRAARPADRNEACRQLTVADAIPALQQAAADAAVRSCAVSQLRLRGASSELIELAGQGQPGARAQALHELGVMKDREAIQALITAVKDQDPLVSASALNSLLMFDDVRVLPTVLEIASRESTSSLIAVNSLGRFHDTSVLPVLYKLLNSQDPLLRLAAIGALGDAGDRSSIARLQPVLGEGNDLRPAPMVGIGFFPAVNMARAARVAIQRIQAREDAHGSH